MVMVLATGKSSLVMIRYPYLVLYVSLNSNSNNSN